MAMFVGMAMRAVPDHAARPLLAVPLRRVLPAGGRLAADALLSNPRRTAATAVALTIGLSVVVVNSSMSASFIGTIQDQLTRTFARDFTVQARASRSSRAAGRACRGSSQRAIEAMPEAGTVAPIRAIFARPARSRARRRSRASRSASIPRRSRRWTAREFQGISPRGGLRGVARGGVADRARRTPSAPACERGDTLACAARRASARARSSGVDRHDRRDAAAWRCASRSTRCRASTATTSTPSSPSRRARRCAAARSRRRSTALLDRAYPNLEMQSAADAKGGGQRGDRPARSTCSTRSSPSRSS